MSDSSVSSRILTFANSCVAVEYADDRSAELINFLYGFLPEEQSGDPAVRFRLICESSDKFRLFQDESVVAESEDEATIVETLLGMSCYQLAAASVGGLLLHAAAISWHQQCAIFVGASGTGKSTLTAWLLCRQFTYMTDELVFIPQNSSTIHAFTRPLNLKKPSRKVLDNLVDYNSRTEGVISTARIDLVSPLLFQQTIPVQQNQLQIMIFPQYQPQSSYQCNLLSPAQTGFRLMQHLLNARNLSQHGFTQIVQLARTVVAYEITYPNFEALGDSVQQLKNWLACPSRSQEVASFPQIK